MGVRQLSLFAASTEDLSKELWMSKLCLHGAMHFWIGWVCVLLHTVVVIPLGPKNLLSSIQSYNRRTQCTHDNKILPVWQMIPEMLVHENDAENDIGICKKKKKNGALMKKRLMLQCWMSDSYKFSVCVCLLLKLRQLEIWSWEQKYHLFFLLLYVRKNTNKVEKPPSA